MAKHKKIGRKMTISVEEIHRVFNVIRWGQPIMRSQVSDVLGLPSGIVSGIVDKLINIGVVIEESEKGAEKKKAGRPANFLHIVNRSKLGLAVDLEPDHLRIALLDLSLAVVAYGEYSIDRYDESEKILNKMVLGCKNLLGANPKWREKVIGVSVALPGMVDVEKGVSISSTNMHNWKNVAVSSLLREALNLPVMVGKSIHLVALAERWRTQRLLDKNVICLVLRTGVGASILVRGELYVGSDMLDGEIGHTVIDMNGNTCECGKQGCLETYVSSTSVRNRAIELIKNNKGKSLLASANNKIEEITPELIYQLAKEGDNECEEIVRDMANYLGLAAANLVQILNPDEIIICGSIDIADEIILNQMGKVIRDKALTESTKNLKISLSIYKDRAALLGAGAMLFEDMIQGCAD